jgi:hypothetical protein
MVLFHLNFLEVLSEDLPVKWDPYSVMTSLELRATEKTVPSFGMAIITNARWIDFKLVLQVWQFNAR